MTYRPVRSAARRSAGAGKPGPHVHGAGSDDLVVREAVSACRQPVPVRIRHPAVTPAETRAVVELVGRTVSADAIAYTLGVAARTVQRHRARLHP